MATAVKDPGELTKAQLVDICKTLGLDEPPAKARKQEIVDRVQAHVDSAAHLLAVIEPESVEAQQAAHVVSVGAEYGFAPPADEDEGIDHDASDDEPEPALVPPPVAEDLARTEEMALAIRQEAPSMIPSLGEFNAMREMAAAIAGTLMVPVAYRGRPDDVLAAILTGRELNLGPMQSLRDIYVVDGKPSLSANLLLARLRRGGIVILESQSNAERAWIRAKRQDTGEVAEVEWTYAEAEPITYRKKGGATGRLIDKDNWTNYPADMLWARAVGRLARRLGPDLIGAAMPYTAEEMQDWDDYDATADRRTPVRRERAPEITPARSWAELTERLCGLLGEHEAKEWLRQAIGARFNGRATSELNAAERDLAFQMSNHVLYAVTQLEAEIGDLRFQTGIRDRLRKIIEARFEGFEILGPEWRLDPTETERPESPYAPAKLEWVAGTPSTDQGEPEAVVPADDDYSDPVDADGNPIKF